MNEESPSTTLTTMHGRWTLVAAVLWLFAGTCNAEIGASDAYYTAGVVEFRPTVAGMSSADLVQTHVDAYVEIVESMAARDTDIIVFPEGTLNNALQLTAVPAAEDAIVPCQHRSSYAPFLVQLSCAAQRVRKYLVVNVSEQENCTDANESRPCATNGLSVYNTNVVFDRDGCVISRYRKWHVYVEAKNTTLSPEYAVFETDFGVRFGHFICFDMLFHTPAVELVARYGLTDLIVTSFFYSELPFLTAVQLQQSWAWANNVNLLAAGASLPAVGATGSGIFAGRKGALRALMTSGDGRRELLVARVPKMNRKMATDSLSGRLSAVQSRVQRHHSGLKLLQDPNITDFRSELLDFVADGADGDQCATVTHRLCSGGLCCRFQIAARRHQAPDEVGRFYRYRLGAFDGRRTYEKKEWSSLQICAVYACRNASVVSCGELFDDTTLAQPSTIFQLLHIEAEFEKTDHQLLMPNSLTDQLYPLAAEAVDWQLSDRGKYYNVQFNLTLETNNLLTFGIYVNYFDKASSSPTDFGGVGVVFLLLLTSTFVNIL